MVLWRRATPGLARNDFLMDLTRWPRHERRSLTGLRVKLRSGDMAEPYYFVRVAKSESWARHGSSDLLVQLVCRDHAQLYEGERERWARQLARDAMVERYPAAAEDIGYTDAKRFSGNVPATLRAADFPAPCGCRVWYGA
jgi:hypothetical protein